MANERLTVEDHVASSPSDVYRRTESYIVDGKRLGEMEPAFRSDPSFDHRYTARFAEVLTIAFTLSVLGLEDVRLEQRERPDFHVIMRDGKSAYVEVSSVVGTDSAHYTSLLDQVNIELRRIIAEDQAVAQSLEGKFAEVIIPRTPERESRSLLVDELRKMVLNEELSSNEPRLEKVSDKYAVLHALGAQLFRGRPSGYAHFAVRGPARAVGPYDLVSLTIQRLRRKREQARSYDGRPLWLVLYFGELLAVYDSNLQMLADIIPQEPIEPFERVFVGDQRRIIEVKAS